MLVILLADSELNELAASGLARDYKVDECFIYPDIERIAAHKELTLVALEANGKFHSTFSSKALGEFLLKNKLLKDGGVINLLVSENNIAVYAADLVHFLQAEHGITVEVRIVEDLNYDNVFIAPPKNKEDQWKIYGLDDAPTPLNYQTLLSEPNKTLIWEGQNIVDWCIDNDKIIKNITKIPDDLDIGDAYQASMK